MSRMETITSTQVKTERSILMLCDDWNALQTGITGVNRSLAQSLAQFKGVKIYCLILSDPNQLPVTDVEDAQSMNVTLIGPSEKKIPSGNLMDSLFSKFNDDPINLFPNLNRQLPYVTHIVGHMPYTAAAAVKLRDKLYEDSIVMLFYHVIPEEVDWLSGKIPYVVPSATELIELAQRADVVYSVTEKIHWYFTAKFRNRATEEIDHRLYLPLCSESVFRISRKIHEKGQSPKILVLAPEGRTDDWLGIDIAACAVNKVTLASVQGSHASHVPVLVIGGVKEEYVGDVKELTASYITSSELKVEVHVYKQPQDLWSDLSQCTMCINPSRTEPSGHMALQAMSSGIPTLIAEDSAISSMVRRLSSEPDYFLVPVTKSTSAVRQDASVWRDKIFNVLADPEFSHKRATQLSTALRREELTKETHDNVVICCLGGIRIKHEVFHLSLILREDEATETPLLRAVNNFTLQTLKQAWRLKHHPLTTKTDLHQLLPGVRVPVDLLIENVINKIEEFDRRIVGIDTQTGSFVVYSPSPSALSDLWAMCDVINGNLWKTLFSGSENEILHKFGATAVNMKTVMSGPHFLKYKKALINRSRPKTAAF